MDCCHQIGVRLRERRPRAEDAMPLANRVPPCGTCGGVPHVSGLPCVCDGANTVYAEVQGLRPQLTGAAAEVGKRRPGTVGPAAGRARVEARPAGDGAVSAPLAEMIQARVGAEWRCAPAPAAAVRAYAR